MAQFMAREPIGVIGIACPDERPLLAAVTALAAAISMGNTVVLIPSEHAPLSATDLYQVLDTSDVPGGVVNIVTGARDALAKVLAEHNDVDAIWYFGGAEGSTLVERLSAGNMSVTSEVKVGAAPASAAPRPMRATISIR